jgi:hypothetical protein
MNKKVLSIGSLVVALTLLSSFALIPAVNAYGNTALWQLGFSFTCNNVSDPNCGGAKGGQWGWAEFDSGGQGDIQYTAYFVSPGVSGVGTGLFHLSMSITSWVIDTSNPSAFPFGTFEVLSGSAVATGGTIHGSVNIPDLCAIGFCGDTGFPATPGHYTALSLFGFSPGPGLAFQIQVVQLNHKDKQ